MNLPQIKAIITSGIAHLYDPEEALAIAKGYISDKLGLKLSDRSESITLPPFFDDDMRQLASGKPLQYVTGIQFFFGRPFLVNESVLIPRPETEELTQWIHENIKASAPGIRILDIGTGSGCIPITLNLNNPGTRVYGVDVSPEALEIATQNANILKATVKFIKDDILNPVHHFNEKFDIIVSNPPYIPKSESGSLAVHVIGYEPHLALFVPDDDPILFYKKICNFALKHLRPNGVIYFEVHPDYIAEIVNYLKIMGFSNIITRKDLSGHNRFIKATGLLSID